MKTIRLFTLFILASFVSLGFQGEQKYFSNTLMLKVKEKYRGVAQNDGIADPEIQKLFSSIGAETIQKKFPNHQKPAQTHNEMGVKLADLSLIYKITYSGKIDAKEMGYKLMGTGFFEYADVEYIQHVLYNPNDPEIASQYHLTNISAYQAWDVSQGDTSIVIGISDTGIELTHDDIEGNLKYNYNEIPGNGVDDDGNGYIDDHVGWDFGNNDNDPSLEPISKHGQSVSGTAAAITDNGLMVSGSAFKTRILPIKILSTSGFLLNSYESIVYAADNGCKIINCSWGSVGTYTQYGQDIVTYAAINNNCLVVGAAGNDNNTGVYYPASFDFAISVGATTASDTKWDFSGTKGSNYNEHIDMCAPGHNIYTTTTGNTTISGRAGTSFAAPLVSGAAVVAWANNPGFTSGMQVGELLKATADSLELIPGNGSWSGLLGEGRLNMHRSVTEGGHPGLYPYDYKYSGNNEGRFAPGDTVDIWCTVLNYLNSSSAGTQVTISSNSAFLNIINPTITVGSIAGSGSLDMASTPFRVEVLPGMPAGELVGFIFTITDGTYNTKRYDEEYFNIDYVDLDINNLGISVGGSGKIGYNSITTTSPGLGVTFEGSSSMVYNIGFIATDNSSQVSFVLDGDFDTETSLKYEEPGVESDADVYTHFNDAPADSSLDISVKQKSLAWTDTELEDMVILEYTVINNSASDYTNMHLGIFADWDIGQYDNNEANWDATTNTAYANEVGGNFGALHLFDGSGIQHYAVNNDGSNGSFSVYDGMDESEQFSSITNGNSRTSAPVGDVSHFVGNGPYTIPSGDSVVFAIAVIAGNNLAEIQASALEADTIYDEIRNIEGTIVSTQDPTCYGFSNGEATIAATGGIGSYTYLWSDAGAQTTPNASGLSAGTYYCVVTDSLGQFDTIFNVIINDPAPVAVSLGNDTTLCDGASTTLDAGNPGANFIWSTGHITQTLLVDTAGQYHVEVTDGIGCKGRDTIQISTSTSPLVNIGPADSTICTGDSVVLDAGNPGLTFLWSSGGSSQTEKFMIAGAHWVRVTNLSGCFGSDSLDLTIEAFPTVSLGNDTTLCDGASTTLDAGNPGLDYLWSTGHSTQTIVTDTAGQYEVTVTSGAGCIGRDTAQVFVSTAPIVDIGPTDSTICSGDTVTLDAGNPGLNFLWSHGGASQTAEFTVAGKHWVRVTNFSGCSSSDTLDLNVVPMPFVDLGNDIISCDSYSGSLDAGNPGASYLWSTGGTGQTIAITTAGVYYVDVSNGGMCFDTDTVELIIEPTPNVELGADTSVCKSSGFTLDAGPGASYLWNNFKTSQIITVDIEGEYYVTVGEHCVDSDTINVSYLSDPIVWYNSNFQTGYLPGHGDVLLDFGNPSGGVYSGTAVTGNIFNTVASGTGNFKIDYTYTDPSSGCAASTWINIWVDPDVSTFEVADGKINIYPNPFGDVLNVEFNGNFNESNGQMILFDGLGKVVAQKEISAWSGSTSAQISTSGLAKGSYYLVLSGDKMYSRHKLVK